MRPLVHISRAARLLLMNVTVVAGGFTLVALLLAACLCFFAWRRLGSPSAWYRNPVVRYALFALVFQLGMFAVMAARHSAIFLYVDHRYWYYPLPFLATVLYGALLLVDGVLTRLTARERRAVPLILAGVVVSNLLSLEGYRQAMTTGPYFASVTRQSRLLKESISEGAADPALEPGYRAFFTGTASCALNGHAEQQWPVSRRRCGNSHLQRQKRSRS